MTTPSSLDEALDGWDDLVRRSRSNHVFLRSAWIRSAAKALVVNPRLIAVRCQVAGELVGACILWWRNGQWELAGSGPADYLDIPVDVRIPIEQAVRIQACILAEIGQLRPRPAPICLCHMIEGPSHPRDHFSQVPGYFTVLERRIPAPTINKESLSQTAKRTSLKRKENGLARLGTVSCQHWTQAEDILPRLSGFFELHVRRWANTSHPSPFCRSADRTFIEELTRALSAEGSLRYTEVRLDDRLVAAHFGFVDGGRFIWYKPCYDVDLAPLSPGTVLLRRLFLRAVEEDVSEFDFTIGDEEFKRRYATEQRTVVDLYLTPSQWRAAYLKTKKIVRRAGRKFLENVGMRRRQTELEPLPTKLD